MGIFGWSYPPGCNSLPDDEPSALELKAPNLPKGYTAWWDEYGDVLLQDPEGYSSRVPLFNHEWDDDLDEAANVKAAEEVLDNYFEKEGE